MTNEEARAAYLALDGVTEGEHHGHPDFRANNKIFGSLFPEKGVAVLRLPLEMSESLVAEDHSRRLVSRMGGMGWLELKLESTRASDFADLAAIALATRQRDGSASKRANRRS